MNWFKKLIGKTEPAPQPVPEPAERTLGQEFEALSAKLEEVKTARRELAARIEQEKANG